MDVEVVVEIPKGTRNKYEADHETGQIWLDRMLFTSTRYPEDYGYVPGTLAADGDPLDALVLLEEPTFPGCHVRARPVGVFLMSDEHGDDAKLLCVTASDPRQADVQDLSDLPPHELEEIAHFFAIYKSLEPGKETTLGGWRDPQGGGRSPARGPAAVRGAKGGLSGPAPYLAPRSGTQVWHPALVLRPRRSRPRCRRPGQRWPTCWDRRRAAG